MAQSLGIDPPELVGPLRQKLDELRVAQQQDRKFGGHVRRAVRELAEALAMMGEDRDPGVDASSAVARAIMTEHPDAAPDRDRLLHFLGLASRELLVAGLVPEPRPPTADNALLEVMMGVFDDDELGAILCPGSPREQALRCMQSRRKEIGADDRWNDATHVGCYVRLLKALADR